jgi:4'-phosphopantetheinyl transferase
MSCEDIEPPGPLGHLSPHEVHVWWANLGRPAEEVRELETLLSEDERRRADGFYFEKDREHYIVSRGTLRSIIGLYLDSSPARLRFSCNDFGKPFLAEELGRDGLSFNLSHSQGLALYGLTRGRKIGVDVEYVRPDVNVAGIAANFFSPREVAALNSLPPCDRRRAFFTCWARKEAYIKARGEGVSLPLDSFTVSLKPGEPAALLDVAGDPLETARWQFHDLAPAPDYAAAVAAEGHDWRLTARQWVGMPPT